MTDAFQPTAWLLGSNYWIGEDDSATAPARIVGELLATLRRGGPGVASLRSILWYSFPCHPRIENSTAEPPFEMHARRDAAMRQLLRETWGAHGGPGGLLANVSLGILPTCALARAALSAFSVDNIHLACRWDPMPDPYGQSRPVNLLKGTLDGSCDNPTDFTNARVLLTTMCPHVHALS